MARLLEDWVEMTTQDIAAVLGLTYGEVRLAEMRGLKKVRQAFKRRGLDIDDIVARADPDEALLLRPLDTGP